MIFCGKGAVKCFGRMTTAIACSLGGGFLKRSVEGFLKRFGEGFDCSCLFVGFGKGGFCGDRSGDSEGCSNDRFGDSCSNGPDCGRSGGLNGLVTAMPSMLSLYSCTNSLASSKCLILYY